jgi:REP element-mobilizing transposase RayT
MARPLRIEYAGASYHVMNRGTHGHAVFQTDDDRRFFLNRLAHFADMFRVCVRAYCLMPNHFHLYLCTLEANLSRFMQSLLTSYAVVHNRKHGVSGHLFQGRFRAIVVEDEAYGSEASRYVHLNPVRTAVLEDAGAEKRRATLQGYEWSSYASVVGLRRCPAWLDRQSLLRPWGRTVRQQQRAYAEYVEEGLVRDIPDPLKAAAARAILGTEPFVDRIRRVLVGAAEKLDSRRELPQAAALGAWTSLDDLVETVAAVYKTEPGLLLRRHSRGNEARQVLLYLACRHCRGREPLRELASRLGPISVGGLTHARYVMAKRLEEEPALRRRVSRIEAQVRQGDKYKK